MADNLETKVNEEKKQFGEQQAKLQSIVAVSGAPYIIDATHIIDNKFREAFNDNRKPGEAGVKIDEKIAEELATVAWEELSDKVATQYYKLTPAKINYLKGVGEIKNPDTGATENVYARFIEGKTEISKADIKKALLNQGVLTRENISELANYSLNGHVKIRQGEGFQAAINDNDSAEKMLEWLNQVRENAPDKAKREIPKIEYRKTTLGPQQVREIVSRALNVFKEAGYDALNQNYQPPKTGTR